MNGSGSSASGSNGAPIGRILGVLAIVAATVAVAVLLFSGSGGHSYKLLFETGGQLVPGNQVEVAGQSIGEVNSITLTDDGQAEVKITIDEQLREGTSAVIRSPSLSAVAGRNISITRGPDNAPTLPGGSIIDGEDTTAPVDLDQLFNTFRPKERRALQKFISGNAGVYAGRGEEANRAYEFLNPALSTSERLFTELTRDSEAFERFLVEGASVFGALAASRDELSQLVGNANTALGAVANQNDSLDRSLVALPPTLRQANTTFVNLRSTLDDLDPLVATSKVATKDLAPFLRRLRPVSRDAIPVFEDLADVVNLDGGQNDLAEALDGLPDVSDRASNAFPAAIEAMDDSQENLEFIRPYTPDLFSFISKFGTAASYYDANGHYLRVMPTATNTFLFNDVTNELEEAYSNQAAQFDPFEFGVFRRCPGGGTQQAADGSNPFLDQGKLDIGDCDPSDIPPGP